MTNPNIRRFAAEIGAACPDPTSLVAQWRDEDALGQAECETLRAVLVRLHLLLFPRWPNAARGDVDAAVGIGIYVTADPTSPMWLVDHVGAALWLCALEGSSAASCVLDHLRRRHADRCCSNESEA